MKFGQKLVYIILKHLQKNAVENITLSPRKLISKFWSTGATMGGRGLNLCVIENGKQIDAKE